MHPRSGTFTEYSSTNCEEDQRRRLLLPRHRVGANILVYKKRVKQHPATREFSQSLKEKGYLEMCPKENTTRNDGANIFIYQHF